MNIKITKHTTTKEYYSVEFPKGVNLSEIARILGVNKMTVTLWKQRIPKHRITELMGVPESMVKK